MLDLPKQYNPSAAQNRWYKFWESKGYFHSAPDPAKRPYCIVIPPPNVTGALHLGHALNNTLQDILIRQKRMQGYATLWMPGTDHAGIATQAVVERRLLQEEKLSRHQLGREGLVERIWQWKNDYEKRILGQLKEMGCSCDWERTRFTLDPVCARAVRHTFFKMFRDRLIYRGKRLVNWDTMLQTAVSDDEVFHETVKGHFWYFRYPVIDPRPGEPQYVTVATTRPETMLGDTAVAVHPAPAAALDRAEAELKSRLEAASTKEKPDLQRQIDDLQERRRTMLGPLETLACMAREGRKVRLPLLNREMPLVADIWAKPELGTGCVKITPAHDPNDYDVGLRQKLPMINVLNFDGTLNENAGPYKGLTVQKARQKVVADLEALGLVEKTEPREIELAHSDRSKTPIEPLLADQWFVKMDQLAQTAMDAVRPPLPPGEGRGEGSLNWQLAASGDVGRLAAVSEPSREEQAIPPSPQPSPGGRGGQVRIIPQRYAKSYLDWLSEKRDWPVSRQLWWGHQIPIWYCRTATETDLVSAFAGRDDIDWKRDDEHGQWLICALEEDLNEDAVPGHKLVREQDVLDTWFSSALWPHSTLGWPEQTPELEYYYPTSVLITSRDIITLWVARMVITGLYNVGKAPFHDVFIHPKILDGYGETMSKTKGNGVDPLDVIEKFGADALRFALAYLTTETQDVRMPVEYECPHCEKLIEQTKENRVRPRVKCKHCGKEFSTQWAEKEADKALPRGAVVSERFEIGRNFCNKLWNAARFALMNLEGYTHGPVADDELLVEDRWILSRLATVTQQTTDALAEYRYADAAKSLYGFAWDEFCSFYVEMVKARLSDPALRPAAQRVLAHVLDTILRLLHPMIPFVTEEIWQLLGDAAPRRGIAPGTGSARGGRTIAQLSEGEQRSTSASPCPSPVPEGEADLAVESIMIAPWPEADMARQDPKIEARFARFQEVLRAIRDIRTRQGVPQRKEVRFSVRCDADAAALLRPMEPYFVKMAEARPTGWGPEVMPPRLSANVALPGMEVFVDLADLIDVEAEKQRAQQEAVRLEVLIAAKQKKLENASFVQRAPAAIVEGERAALKDLEDQLAAAKAVIERLDKGA